MSATDGSGVDSVDGLPEFCRSVELDDVDLAVVAMKPGTACGAKVRQLNLIY